ncbi:4'-phosphopantetheinyl transferase superfamily protein [bacterium]|nr:4'-phosphopantetheinyl transferase superfamily protein [bacterium]
MHYHLLNRSFPELRRELSAHDLANWATDRERRRYAGFSSAKRRREWLLGRLTAKSLVRTYYQSRGLPSLALDQIEIMNDSLGKPCVQLIGALELHDPDRLTVSISHRKDRALCGLAEHAPGLGFGLDLEYVEPRPRLFVETFYHHNEQAQIEQCPRASRDVCITALWSIKEAFLKAIGQGLRLDLRSIWVKLTGIPGQDWLFPILICKGIPDHGSTVRVRYVGDFIESLACCHMPEQWPVKTGQGLAANAQACAFS